MQWRSVYGGVTMYQRGPDFPQEVLEKAPLRRHFHFPLHFLKGHNTSASFKNTKKKVCLSDVSFNLSFIFCRTLYCTLRHEVLKSQQRKKKCLFVVIKPCRHLWRDCYVSFIQRFRSDYQFFCGARSSTRADSHQDVGRSPSWLWGLLSVWSAATEYLAPPLNNGSDGSKISGLPQASTNVNFSLLNSADGSPSSCWIWRFLPRLLCLPCSESRGQERSRHRSDKSWLHSSNDFCRVVLFAECVPCYSQWFQLWSYESWVSIHIIVFLFSSSYYYLFFC